RVLQTLPPSGNTGVPVLFQAAGTPGGEAPRSEPVTARVVPAEREGAPVVHRGRGERHGGEHAAHRHDREPVREPRRDEEDRLRAGVRPPSAARYWATLGFTVEKVAAARGDRCGQGSPGRR